MNTNEIPYIHNDIQNLINNENEYNFYKNKIETIKEEYISRIGLLNIENSNYYKELKDAVDKYNQAVTYPNKKMKEYFNINSQEAEMTIKEYFEKVLEKKIKNNLKIPDDFALGLITGDEKNWGKNLANIFMTRKKILYSGLTIESGAAVQLQYFLGDKVHSFLEAVSKIEKYQNKKIGVKELRDIQRDIKFLEQIKMENFKDFPFTDLNEGIIQEEAQRVFLTTLFGFKNIENVSGQIKEGAMSIKVDLGLQKDIQNNIEEIDNNIIKFSIKNFSTGQGGIKLGSFKKFIEELEKIIPYTKDTLYQFIYPRDQYKEYEDFVTNKKELIQYLNNLYVLRGIVGLSQEKLYNINLISVRNKQTGTIQLLKPKQVIERYIKNSKGTLKESDIISEKGYYDKNNTNIQNIYEQRKTLVENWINKIKNKTVNI